MTTPVRLLAFAGSLRSGSYNRRLIHTLAGGALRAGAQVDLIQLRDFPLPIYDGDLESAAMPENVHALQAKLAAADGLLIATPEYNGSMPALVKNTLDWMSRPQADGSDGTRLFAGKVAGICSASPGALGGLRSLLVLRDALSKLGMWVCPAQVAVGGAGTAFAEDGTVIDERRRAQVEAVGEQVTRAAAALRRSA